MKTSTQAQWDLQKEQRLLQESLKNPAKFKPVYEHYYERIFRFVYSRIQEKEITADVTSMVFVKALTNLKKYKFKGFPFSSWLFRLAINECADHFRAEKKQRYVVLEDYYLADLVQEVNVEESQLSSWLDVLPEVLETLPTRDLDLIELRFFQSKSFKEIAEILDLTEGNAKTRTYRILEKLKKKFDEKRQTV